MSPRLRRASVWLYRLYDVAEAIDLAAVERLLGGARMRIARAGAESLRIKNPPLAVSVGTHPIELVGARHADATVRLYDYGALTVLLKVHLPEDAPWSELEALSDAALASPAVDRVATSARDALLPQIAPALSQPGVWSEDEDYTIFFVEEVEGRPSAERLAGQVDLARLLLGEPTSVVSAREREEVLSRSFSYYADDLAVVDWNSALVYEPSGSTDVPDVLEMALAQLLELRYFDALVDRELGHISRAVSARSGGLRALVRFEHGPLSRRVTALLLELTELSERVEGSLKTTGDFYLARVYRGATRRFDLPLWRESVERKQALVMRAYHLLKGELDARRSQLLELIIVLLIVGEILLFFGVGG